MTSLRRPPLSSTPRRLFRAFLTVSAIGLLSSPALAMSRPVTVVELFTSQGCSSVPPANRNLVDLDGRGDILPLSFSVTYWDHLGWKDTFAHEAFTTRQRVYAPSLGRDGPFTPQIVVNGAIDTIGNEADALHSLVEAAGPADAIPIEIKDRAVEIGRGAIPASGADVWLVRYRPGVQSVDIARGENAGTTLPVGNVVTDIHHIGRWLGISISLSTSLAEPGLRTAVLVQAPLGGPILSAATN